MSSIVEIIGDVKILRYEVPGWENLNQRQKKLLRCLYNTSLYGRDIYYDQNSKYGLYFKHIFEKILKHNPYLLRSTTEENKAFVLYVRQFWINNGIHNETSGDKTRPLFSEEYFRNLLYSVKSKITYPSASFLEEIISVIFNPDFCPKKTTLDSIEHSSTNFYQGLTTSQVLEYHKSISVSNDPEPEEHGLNSQLISLFGQIKERKYKIGGLYSQALKKIVKWLVKALRYTESPEQHAAFLQLISYYTTGNLKTFIEYCKYWVSDINSDIDMIHGFQETYDCPLGFRGSFESIVTIRDFKATERIKLLQTHVQYFEDNSPVMPEHKKKVAKGIDARVVNVITECGDASPVTPIGVCLPNADWFKAKYGSKSINMANIDKACDAASTGNGVTEEFYTPSVCERIKLYDEISYPIFVDMHEVLGHGSGQIEEHVKDAGAALGGCYSVLEETRADLFGLYYIMDPFVQEIGLIPNKEAGMAIYDQEFTHGLLFQLTQVDEGETQLTQTHMRNRHLIASWVYEHSLGAVKKEVMYGKTYFNISPDRGYETCRRLFGVLLREIQRIKSQGDREAGEKLVRDYGTFFDQKLHKEALERFFKLKTPPFTAFIQPEIDKDSDGKIVLTYPESFTDQMIKFGKKFKTLPLFP